MCAGGGRLKAKLCETSAKYFEWVNEWAYCCMISTASLAGIGLSYLVFPGCRAQERFISRGKTRCSGWVVHTCWRQIYSLSSGRYIAGGHVFEKKGLGYCTSWPGHSDFDECSVCCCSAPIPVCVTSFSPDITAVVERDVCCARDGAWGSPRPGNVNNLWSTRLACLLLLSCSAGINLWWSVGVVLVVASPF